MARDDSLLPVLFQNACLGEGPGAALWVWRHFLSLISSLLIGIYSFLIKTSKGALFRPPSDVSVEAFSLLYFNKTLLHKSSQWSSLITGPGLNSSPPEAKNPGVIHYSPQWQPFTGDCNPPGSFVHGILQAIILDWIAISSSRGSSQPRDRTSVPCVSCTGRQVPYHQCHLGSQTHGSRK